MNDSQREKKAFLTWNIALWGGLIIVVIVNVYVAVIASRSPFELSEEDAYGKSLDYETTHQHKANALAHGWQVQYADGEIYCTRNGTKEACPAGNLVLQRPNDASLDQSFAIQAVTNTQGLTVQPGLVHGRWNVEFNYEWQGQNGQIAHFFNVEQ